MSTYPNKNQFEGEEEREIQEHEDVSDEHLAGGDGEDQRAHRVL